MANERKVGVITAYAKMFLSIFVSLLYVPILLRFLTVNEFGLYQMIGSFMAYLAVFDFGLTRTLTRYYSQTLAYGSSKERENILALSFCIYAVIAVFIIAVGMMLYINIDSIFKEKLTAGELVEAKQMLIVVIVNVAIITPTHVFRAVMSSHERFLFVNTVAIVQVLLQPVAILAVLFFKNSALYILLVQTIVNVSVAIINAWYCFHKLHVRVKFHEWKGDLILEMLRYSFWVFLAVATDMFYWRSGQLVVGGVIGTAAAAVFSIVAQLCLYTVSFTAEIGAVFVPKLSVLSGGKGNNASINQVYLSISRIQFFVVNFIFIGFIVLGKEFIRIWAGPDFSEAYLLTVIILLSLVLPMSQNIAIYALQAMNKHMIRSIITVISSLATVLLSIPICREYGLMGCGLTIALGLFIGNGIIATCYYYRVGFDVKKYLYQIFMILPALLLVLFLTYTINYFIPVASGYLLLFVKAFFFSVIFFVSVWFLACNDYEKQLVGFLVNKLRNRVK